MKKFAVGYQQSESGVLFYDIIKDYAEHISELFFPWVGGASGRAILGEQRGYRDWSSQAQLEHELMETKKLGIKLDILFNANCYGGKAVSQHLENEIRSVLDYLGELVGGIDVVTTTSLAIARTVKHYFPQIDVRASVNMRIGTVEAMKMVEGLFDSFYLQRDLQRNLKYVKEVRKWCDANNKKLCMLANSGCFRSCPGQSFHDNMVAHDGEIDEVKNVEGWIPFVCWNNLRKKEFWPAILQSTWIRPEDLKHYQEYFDVIKLATRLHSNPRMVLEAYSSGTFRGNLADLCEPCYSPALAPNIIDNAAFGDDFFKMTSSCDGHCEQCDFCKKYLEKVLVNLGG